MNIQMKMHLVSRHSVLCSLHPMLKVNFPFLYVETFFKALYPWSSCPPQERYRRHADSWFPKWIGIAPKKLKWAQMLIIYPESFSNFTISTNRRCSRQDAYQFSTNRTFHLDPNSLNFPRKIAGLSSAIAAWPYESWRTGRR